MPSRNTSNQVRYVFQPKSTLIVEAQYFTNPGSVGWTPQRPTSQGSQYSPLPGMFSVTSPALHLVSLQPPAAPHMSNVPLPNTSPSYPSRSAMPDAFPVDLTRDIDFNSLAGRISNRTVPAQTTIHIVPTSGDRLLFDISTGDRPMTTISVIRRLHSLIRAPLSIEFLSQLPFDVQQSVMTYFLAISGRNGSLLWQGFLNRYHNAQGPTGAVLLQGHFYVWGLFQDRQSHWVLNVDIPRARHAV
ncbi:hypothetical protein C8J57DRAFT_1325637 [Mycena rebaudengoi]|nr:hypothetical protein C8J57DRAFT_1325637 [Mycena rebaudengoi]